MNAIARLLVFGIVLVGCASGGASPAPSSPGNAVPVGLAGRTFLSTSVKVGGVDKPLAPNTQIRLQFNGPRDLGASAGCNSFGGTWQLDGAILRVQGGGMTEMGCDEPRHAQDDWFFGFIGGGPTVALNDNDLVLTLGDTVIALVDREIAEPDKPLIGTTWTLVSILAGDAVSSIPDGAAASFTIDANGQVTFNTGCNDGGGAVVIEQATLTFKDLVATDKACIGAGEQVEKAFTDVIGGGDPLTWELDADSLWLTIGDSGLQFQGT